MATYLNITNFSELRKSINLVFKQAANLEWLTPTRFIENYLYGCSFDDYCTHRINTLCKSFIKDKDPLFESTRITRNRVRPVQGARFGKFLKKYATIVNTEFETYFKQIPRKDEKKAAFKSIMDYKSPFKKSQTSISDTAIEPQTCPPEPQPENAQTPTTTQEVENAQPAVLPRGETVLEASAPTLTTTESPPTTVPNVVDGEAVREDEAEVEEEVEAATAALTTRKRKRTTQSPDLRPRRKRRLSSTEVSDSID